MANGNIDLNPKNSESAKANAAPSGSAGDTAGYNSSPLLNVIKKTNGADATSPSKVATPRDTAIKKEKPTQTFSVKEVGPDNLGIAKVKSQLQNLLGRGAFGTGAQEGGTGTNLVKDQEVLFIDWASNIRMMSFTVLLSALFIGVLYAALVVWGQIKISEGKEILNKLEDVDQKIALEEKDMEPVFIFQKKLKLTKNIISNHVYWTDFFDFLEDTTLPDVYYTAFKGGIDGAYEMSVNAPNFSMAADQIDILKSNPYVMDVTTTGGKVKLGSKIVASSSDLASGISLPTNVINFNLNLKIDPEIFYSYDKNKAITQAENKK